MKLRINGKDHQVEVDPAMPLLWAVRDVVGLKGTKFGCGKGLCGSCTMHLNGVAIRSCSTPVAAAEGSSVTTIEGLADSDPRLQKAWADHNVPQCGYCQAGQIMSAASLLAQNKAPSDQDIDTAMSGNICRCGTYVRIKTAIKAAAKMTVARTTP